MEYNFRSIEKKWRKRWAEEKPFKVDANSEKPKYYVLLELYLELELEGAPPSLFPFLFVA